MRSHKRIDLSVLTPIRASQDAADTGSGSVLYYHLRIRKLFTKQIHSDIIILNLSSFFHIPSPFLFLMFYPAPRHCFFVPLPKPFPNVI
jgi:hypothetical protein